MWYDKVDIVVNADSWNATSAENRTSMLLHELGHVFSMLKGAGGSQFKYDYDIANKKPDDAAEKFNSDLLKKCGFN